jgi:hypothetical protein
VSVANRKRPELYRLPAPPHVGAGEELMSSEFEQAGGPTESVPATLHLRVIVNKTSLLVEIRVTASKVVVAVAISGVGFAIVDLVRSLT